MGTFGVCFGVALGLGKPLFLSHAIPALQLGAERPQGLLRVTRAALRHRRPGADSEIRTFAAVGEGTIHDPLFNMRALITDRRPETEFPRLSCALVNAVFDLCVCGFEK